MSYCLGHIGWGGKKGERNRTGTAQNLKRENNTHGRKKPGTGGGNKSARVMGGGGNAYQPRGIWGKINVPEVLS